jgi:hypothetical protein
MHCFDSDGRLLLRESTRRFFGECRTDRLQAISVSSDVPSAVFTPPYEVRAAPTPLTIAPLPINIIDRGDYLSPGGDDRTVVPNEPGKGEESHASTPEPC